MYNFVSSCVLFFALVFGVVAVYDPTPNNIVCMVFAWLNWMAIQVNELVVNSDADRAYERGHLSGHRAGTKCGYNMWKAIDEFERESKFNYDMTRKAQPDSENFTR